MRIIIVGRIFFCLALIVGKCSTFFWLSLHNVVSTGKRISLEVCRILFVCLRDLLPYLRFVLVICTQKVANLTTGFCGSHTSVKARPNQHRNT